MIENIQLALELLVSETFPDIYAAHQPAEVFQRLTAAGVPTHYSAHLNKKFLKGWSSRSLNPNI